MSNGLRSGSLKRIHVNQHVIKANRDLPVAQQQAPLTVKIPTTGENIKAFSVVIKGESTLMYRPSKPLDCGARVWLETRAEVIVAEFNPELEDEISSLEITCNRIAENTEYGL